MDRVDFLRRAVTVDRQLITPSKGDPRFGPVKRAASNRVVPLPTVVADTLAYHLQQYGEGPDRLIFTNDRGRRSGVTRFPRSSGVPRTRLGSRSVTDSTNSGTITRPC